MKNFTFFLVFFVTFLSIATKAQPWIQQTASGLIGSADPAVLLTAVDENVCWGINTINNQYLRTTDGGTNWTVSTITGATGSIGSGITALDANTAWVSMNGGIFKTSDGGLTWTQQLTALPSDVIHFFDSNNGVCVADPNAGYWAIYTTTNGGANWGRVPSANIPAPLSGEVGIAGNEAVSAGNTFWFNTWGGSLYKSTDRGNHWTVTRNVIQNQAFGFAFKDSLNGLACTFGSVGNQFISRTSNGGATWTPILPLSAGLSGLTTYYINYVKGTAGSYVITSNNNGGGQTAAIPGSAYTNDDGATWTKNSNIPLGTASFASWNVGWSAGLNTSIYKWSSPVLPVELTSFTAQSKDQSVILNWVTATELNNRGFEIQRKSLVGEFATVAFVNGNGTTTKKNEYSYTDKNLAEGKYSYRLKQVDFSGEYNFSQNVEVDVRSLNSFALEQNYPNPFNPTTTIGYVLQEKSNTKLTLINVIGQEVAILVNEEQDKGYHKVDLSAKGGSASGGNAYDLPSGVYLYKLQAGNFTETKKLTLLK